MSIADGARQLMVLSDMGQPKLMSSEIEEFMYGIVGQANTLLGEDHVGVDAIAGVVVNVVEACEQLRANLGLVEFTIQNICNQIING